MRWAHRWRYSSWRRHWWHIRIKRRPSKGGPGWWRRASHHAERRRWSHERWRASHHGIWWGSWASEPQGLLLSHPQLPRVEPLAFPSYILPTTSPHLISCSFSLQKQNRKKSKQINQNKTKTSRTKINKTKQDKRQSRDDGILPHGLCASGKESVVWLSSSRR